MKSATRWLLLLAVALTWQVAAEASTVWQVDFVLTVEQQYEPTDPVPPLPYVQPTVGEQFFGSILFSDEELTGVGNEALYSAWGQSVIPNVDKLGIQSISLGYYSDQLNEKDAEQYPLDPIITFQDGVFQGLFFNANGKVGDIAIINGAFDIYLEIASGWGHLASGSVTYGTPTAVPTPAVAGAGLSLLTVLGLKRRRRAA